MTVEEQKAYWNDLKVKKIVKIAWPSSSIRNLKYEPPCNTWLSQFLRWEEQVVYDKETFQDPEATS